MAMNLRCYSSTPLLRWNSGTGTVPEVIFRTAPQIGACPAIPILYLLRKVIFMSVVRVTNFFSFFVQGWGQSWGRGSLSILSRSARPIYFIYARRQILLRSRLLTFSPLSDQNPSLRNWLNNRIFYHTKHLLFSTERFHHEVKKMWFTHFISWLRHSYFLTKEKIQKELFLILSIEAMIQVHYCMQVFPMFVPHPKKRVSNDEASSSHAGKNTARQWHAWPLFDLWLVLIG
jgi:hypothetical protein